MADQILEANTEPVPPRSGISWVGISCLLFAATAAGICLPIYLPNLFATEASHPSEQHTSVPSSSRNGMTYVSFGEVTVNLDEGRMNRYLRLKLSLQIREADKAQVEQLIMKRQLVLKNWLLSHLSDKTLDEIRGKAGQNMLRREIRNNFNTVLFSNGNDRIFDILFEEFNVQ